MANPYQPLDLAALAAQAQAETGARVAGGQGHLEASLASMLQEQQGGLAGNAEAQGREQTFQRSQAMLAEQLALREEALQAASAMARARAEAGGGDGPSWFDKQVFQTDEAIRQAKALRALDDADEAKEAASKRPKFGRSVISPERGGALLDTGRKIRSAAKGRADRTFVQQLISNLNPEDDPDLSTFNKDLRAHFAKRPKGAERASIALWDLGYSNIPSR